MKHKKVNRLMLIVLFVLTSLAPLLAQEASAPANVKIKKEHPRLFLTMEDINRLKKSPLLTMEDVNRLKKTPTDEGVVDLALQYLTTSNAEVGRKAVEKLKSTKDVFDCAVAYDWVYNAMTKQERTEIAEHILSKPVRIKMRAPMHNWTYEGAYRAMVRALAIYGETAKPEDSYKEFNDIWKIWGSEDGVIALYEYLKDGDWFESMDYYRHTVQDAILAFAAMDTAIVGGDYFRNLQYLKNTGYFSIYCLRPDRTFYRFGDNDYPPVTDWERRMMLVLANRYKNPHFQWWLNHIVPQFKGYKRHWLFDGIYYDKDLPERSWEDLPLAQLFRGTGVAIFRSGWKLDANGKDDNLWIGFRCGDWFGAHQHADANSFVIHKKGQLALDSGAYCDAYESGHWTSWYCRTIAHNSILVYMPDETWQNKAGGIGVNDGGQLCPWRSAFASTIGQWLTRSKPHRDLGEIPAYEHNDYYSYVCGDATKAYDPRKLKFFTRQLLYLRPEYIVIFDRVESTNPSYKKTWLLHTWEEPKIQGDLTISDRLDGRLFTKTILPENAIITKVGGPGKEFWVVEKNFPMPRRPQQPEVNDDGVWRIEVSPKDSAAIDYFLHVFYPTDRKKEKMADVEIVKKSNLVGVKFSDGKYNFEALFKTTGIPGGTVLITQYGKILIDKSLTEKIEFTDLVSKFIKNP